MEDEINFQPANNKRKIKLWIVVGFSVIITTSLIIYAFFVWQKNKIEQIEQLEKNYQQQIKNIQTQQNQQQPQKDSNNEISNTDDQITQVAKIDIEKIIVEWEKEAIEVKENCNEGDRCFLVGRIINDDPEYPEYKGKSLYLEASPDFMGFYMRHYIIKNNNGTDEKVYVEGEQGAESGVSIVGISYVPDWIIFPGTNYNLKKYSSPSYLFSEVKTKKKLFSDESLGDMYLTEDGCIVAELPDHTAIAYDLVIPFFVGYIPDITFDKGEKNKDEYEYNDLSCGGLCSYLSEVKENLKEDEIEVIGKTNNGEDIYRLKDPNDKRLKDLYNDKKTIAHLDDNYQELSKNKYSYDEFIKLNPYLFWKDPIGRWIQFKNEKFNLAGGMCKPVIYLYPENKTSFDIKVNINGKLTFSDPLYKNGWKVEASPDGQIKNIETGKYYESLLWEGISLNYPKQEKGWVIKKDNLNSFFDEKLTKLGLNNKEANDFKEYWLSRLNEKPFYRISFLNRRQFDNLAAVEFSPIKPTIFIRVMMTAEGLDNYINIPEQILFDTPKRNGFTAVEWGGVLLK